MAVSFRVKEEYFQLHDPMQAGKLIDRQTEIRYDPLTGESSRIIYDPGAPFLPPDYSEIAEKNGGKACPFCNENVLSATPAFPNEQIEGGRINMGEAVAFPNLFPYGKHNAVVRMSEQHYVRLEQFTVPMIMDTFAAAHTYLQQVVASDRAVTHASINWNYLPPSGGSILHPHVHVLASEQYTRYQTLTSMHGLEFQEKHSCNYYTALLEEERRLQQRWIGQVGSLGWMHAFAPKSHCDFIGIYEDAPSFADLNSQSWKALAESMISFFRYFAKVGLASFNLALFIPLEQTPGSWTHIRLIPRIAIGALGTSDMNVFNYVHGEYLSLKRPESVAEDARSFFTA